MSKKKITPKSEFQKKLLAVKKRLRRRKAIGDANITMELLKKTFDDLVKEFPQFKDQIENCTLTFQQRGYALTIYFYFPGHTFMISRVVQLGIEF